MSISPFCWCCVVFYGGVNNHAQTALFCYVGNNVYFCLKIKLMEQDVVKIIEAHAETAAAAMGDLAASLHKAAEAQARLNELVLQHYPPAEGAVMPSTELYYQIKHSSRYGKIQKPKK